MAEFYSVPEAAPEPSLPTVRQILRFSVFDGAEVVAGHRGLDRPVTGVNVMEVPEVARWMKGGELLLTAAYALSREPGLCHTLIRNLADRNVAALVIKRSPYLSQIPQVMLQQAEDSGLPIVIIPSHIPYFQIMDAVLARIYSHQLYLLKRSHEIHRKFTADALQDARPSTVAQVLASLCAHEVFLEDQVGSVLHYVGKLGQRSMQLTSAPKNTERVFNIYFGVRELLRGNEPAGHTIVFQERQAMVGWLQGGGRRLGLLTMVEGGQGFGEMDAVAFGHAMVLASFALLQEKAVKEAVERKNSELLDSLIKYGAPPNSELQATLREHLGEFSGLVALCLSVTSGADVGDIRTQLEQRLLVQGWSWIASTRQDRCLYLVALRDSGGPIEKVLMRSLGLPMGARMGVSAVQLDPASLPSAFRQAQLALKTAEIFGKDSPVFYWQLGADRLLAELGDSPVLKDILWSSLGPLLAPTDTNRELLRTLRAFLDCGGNKEKAARSLFIHRTTLLYRLRKIGRLLGRDLRDPSVRLDLQLALRAMDITDGSWREDRR